MTDHANELRRYAPLLGRPAIMLDAADEIEQLAARLEACEQRDRRQLTADLGGSLEAYRVVRRYLAPGAQGEEK